MHSNCWILNYGKVFMSILQQKKTSILSHGESHISVKNYNKYKLHQITLLTLLLLMFAFACSACSLVSILALLLIVGCRMFLHHVSLEVRRSIALVVAVVTAKKLLASVRSHMLL